MPMSKKNTKEEIIQNKKQSIRLLNNLLEGYIADDTRLRKAELVSKWIKDYVNYLKFEEIYDPLKGITYKRGDIVKVNLGFNIGGEIGGVHYAIVLDNPSPHSCNTMTVIPMSSVKEGKPVHPLDLHIGNEFYNSVSAKYQSMLKDTLAEKEELDNFKTDLLSLIKDHMTHELSEDERTELKSKLNIPVTSLADRINNLNQQIEILEKNKAEIDMMKTGTIVKVRQIRTISKMRILIPKSRRDPLYDVSLSSATMEKINNKLSEFFFH